MYAEWTDKYVKKVFFRRGSFCLQNYHKCLKPSWVVNSVRADTILWKMIGNVIFFRLKGEWKKSKYMHFHDPFLKCVARCFICIWELNLVWLVIVYLHVHVTLPLYGQIKGYPIKTQVIYNLHIQTEKDIWSHNTPYLQFCTNIIAKRSSNPKLRIDY